jgi:hypothetical protein
MLELLSARIAQGVRINSKCQKKKQVNDVSEYFFFSDRLAYFHDVTLN